MPRDELPAVSEEQITAFLNACEPLLGGDTIGRQRAPLRVVGGLDLIQQRLVR